MAKDKNSRTSKPDSDVRVQPLRRRLRCNGSPLVGIVAIIAVCLEWISVFKWISKFTHRVPSCWSIDIFLLIGTGIEIACLHYIPSHHEFCTAAEILATWVLLDNLNATLRDLVVAPIVHNNRILVRDPVRWSLGSMLGALQIVLAFGIIYLVFGHDFVTQNPESAGISNGTTAVYFSVMTFMTVGYGDFAPHSDTARVIVTCEVAFYFLFILVKVPIAITLIKTEQIRTDSPT